MDRRVFSRLLGALAVAPWLPGLPRPRDLLRPRVVVPPALPRRDLVYYDCACKDDVPTYALRIHEPPMHPNCRCVTVELRPTGVSGLY